ncbi:MAG: adenylate/guanylate cyclase domain-containing protein [Polyangiaceae bacterium]
MVSRRGVSIRTKWLSALLVAGVVPLVSFGGFALREQRAGLRDAERSLELAVIAQVSSSIERPLADARATTKRIVSLLSASELADEARISLMTDSVGAAEVLSSVSIFDAKGEFVDAIVRKGESPPDAREPITYDPGDFVGGAWLEPRIQGRQVALQYLEAIVREGRLVAWVRGDVDGAALTTRVSAVSLEHLARPDRVVLLDAKLRAIAGTLEESSSSQAGLNRGILRGIVLDQSMLQRPFGATVEFVNDRSVPMVGTFRSLPEHGWLVVVQRPEDEAYAALAQTRRALMIVGAIFAAIAALVGAWVGTQATRPIRELVDLAKAFAQRQFSASSKVRTGDELESLGDAMVEMARDIERGEQELQRRVVVENNLSRFLPATVAHSIASGEGKISLGGERRVISVLFADVAAFTTFAETAPPEQVVAFLNELFAVMTEVVFRHDGTVDKFIGDSLMALFGAPVEQADHAARALLCAEDLHRFVEASSPAWQQKYGFTVRLAIGVAAGEALVGNLGSDQRMEYTAIGDTVNIASRLEAIAAPGQTLTTAEVARFAGDDFAFQPHESHPLRGRRQPVEVVEPIS